MPTSLTYILLMPEASCLESLMRNRQYHRQQRVTKEPPQPFAFVLLGHPQNVKSCYERSQPSSPRGGFQGRNPKKCAFNGARYISEAPSKAVGNVRFHHFTLSRESKILLYPFRRLGLSRKTNPLSRFFRTRLRMVSTMVNPCCRGCLLHLSTQPIRLSVRYCHQDLH